METVSQRELRNRSADVIRGLADGKSYRVTNRGRPVGILAPISTSRLEEHIVREGTQDMTFDEGLRISEDTGTALCESRRRR